MRGEPMPGDVGLVARVRPGGGLVARNGALLAVLGAGADTDEVLARIERFDATTQTTVDLLTLVRSLPGPASIGLVVVGRESDLVLLGDVRCEVAGPAGSSTFAGSSAAQLVGLPSPIDRITLALAAATAPADPRTTFVDGITPGGGIEITVAAAAGAAPLVLPPPPPAVLPPPSPGAPPPEPQPMPVAASAAVVNVLLAGAPDDEPAREPLPDTPEAMPEHAQPVKVVVRGLACGVGHVNRVDAPYCSACGRRLQGTVNLVAGPRPSLGTLIFDDGTAFGLEHGYVIGREPGNDPAVRSGAAHALPLDDPERAVSRVHAEIRLDGWDTLIVDRGSANGTHVAVPGASAWQRLAPDVPVALADGWSVAIGRRTFVFQQR